MLICECQLRNHDTMPALGVPHVVVREAVRVHPELASAIEVHARNEELFTNFEQEECPVTIRAQPLLVFLHKLDDLRLGEAKTVEAIAHTAEDLGKGAVLDHFVDSDLSLLRRGTPDIRAITLEVTVDPARKSILRFRDGRLAVRFVELQGFGTGDELDDAGDVLGDLGKLLFDQGGDGGDNFVAACPHVFDVLSVEDAVLGELAKGGAGSLAGGIGDQGHAGFDLAVSNFSV